MCFLCKFFGGKKPERKEADKKPADVEAVLRRLRRNNDDALRLTKLKVMHTHTSEYMNLTAQTELAVAGICAVASLTDAELTAVYKLVHAAQVAALAAGIEASKPSTFVDEPSRSEY